MLLIELISLHKSNYFMNKYVNTVSYSQLEAPNILTIHIFHMRWSFNLW